MKRFVLLAVGFGLAICLQAAPYRPLIPPHLGFPVYTNHPPGRQVTANQLPATTEPLSPEETRQLIQVPPGFEVRLFAAEPQVVNPVAMTWDERGRLWVIELYEYPKGAPGGQKGRDRIKILEDVDADGRADKVTVFADGYSLATGLALGNGGVYLGQAPDLLFLEDTDGDDKADKTTKLLTGFGMEDRHELLNGFAWGPDGWLYMTHGVFTHSKVRDPVAGETERGSPDPQRAANVPRAAGQETRAPEEHDPDGFGVQMDAALARFHPRTKKFEVFADGTSNPWGVDWNERGDAFVSACVIHHLFHMAPGGQYNRQGGTWANPYGYVGDLPSKGLPAIVNWRHHRAAHSGICVHQGDQYPAEWRGLVFLGNIHQSALNCDRLTPVGSTYKAEKESTLLGPAGQALLAMSGEKMPKGEEWKFVGPGNFLVSKDPWVRPVSVQTGPDGCLWVMDWYDRYPCYQNAQADPEGVDREYGRIWRVVWTGDQPGKAVPSRPEKGMDLKKSDAAQLVGLLEHSNNWQRRQGQRLLAERKDRNAVPALKKLLKDGQSAQARLAALWTLHGQDALDDDILLNLTKEDPTPVLRAWAARIMGERAMTHGLWARKARGDVPPTRFHIINRLSSSLATLLRTSMDDDASVRAASATAARQFASSSLTVDEYSPYITSEISRPQTDVENNLLMVVGNLIERPSVNGDFYYPHIVWMAVEPRAAVDPQAVLTTVGYNDTSVSAYCARRVMRRICDLADAGERTKHLNAAMEWLGSVASKPGLAEAALDGLIDAFKGKGAPPTIPLEPIFAKLTANPAIADKARRLATLLGDTTASRTLIAKINDPAASVDDRLKGIQAARETKDEAAKAELMKLLKSEKSNQTVLGEGVRALAVFGGDEIGYAITDAWKSFSLPTRRAAADALVTRSKWSRALMAALENKVADPQDVSATARRALAMSPDATVVDHANRVLGKYRATGEDKLKLIADKRRVVLAGEGDARNGYEVSKRTCFVCHKLYGEGADVGPDLTGVGRSTLDALLHNIIDPNEVVGNGYGTTEVELKDGSSVSGRIVEETPARLKLVASGPTEHVIAKSDIAVEDGKPKVRTSELSLMPESLEAIPDKDFRDMIWYLLNPPGDNRPWTPALRRELLGER